MAESTKADEKNEKKVLRRDFLTGSGAAIAAGALAAGSPAAKAVDVPTPAEGEVTYPASMGYIVYDSRLCFGCQSCMYACSMAHQGEANPTLSRIQIVKDAPSFTTYPHDIVMNPCRQCVSPLCVQNCPTGAAHIDTEHGNVRVIDQKKCIGCKRCIQYLSPAAASHGVESVSPKILQVRPVPRRALLEQEGRSRRRAGVCKHLSLPRAQAGPRTSSANGRGRV